MNKSTSQKYKKLLRQWKIMQNILVNSKTDLDMAKVNKYGKTIPSTKVIG
jgi:hypothetical protein